MTSPITRHPSPNDLEDYGLGRLNGPTCEWIEAHVAECDECSQALWKVADDTLVRLARDSATKSLDSLGAARGPLTADVRARAAMSPARPIPVELRDHPRYRVLGLVGIGGMGAVYKAEHRIMSRLVALKVIHGEFLNNRQAVDRFTQEVKAAARLAHPNIVAAYDAEQAGNLHFLVMEFVEGVSLDRYVSQHGPLSPLVAARLVRQAALALDHAAQRGMVHRDIKPHNMMLRRGGELKILDFGLARLAYSESHEVDELGESAGRVSSGQKAATWHDPTRPPNSALDARRSLQRTSTGMLLGTPDYLAPEQARDARTADIRADVYSLGCTFYYLLRGAAPFSALALRETLAAHASADRAPLLDVLGNCPADLRAILGRMLAAEPVNRYQTPAELLLDLDRALSQIESPRPPSALGHATVAVPASPIARSITPERASPVAETFATRLFASWAAAAPKALRGITTAWSSSHRGIAVIFSAVGMALVGVLLARGLGWLGDASDQPIGTQPEPSGYEWRNDLGAERPAASAPADGLRYVLLVVSKDGVAMADYGPLRGALERDGRAKVVTASVTKGPCRLAPGWPESNAQVEADVELTTEALATRDFAAIVFLGHEVCDFTTGSHAAVVRQVIERMGARGKLIGAIGVGQTVLASHGVLAGRDAAWADLLLGRVAPSDARWRTDAGVVVDRNGGFPVVTAATDREAEGLATAILQTLDDG